MSEYHPNIRDEVRRAYIFKGPWSIRLLFIKYNITMSRVRGQGYDGASNMQSEFNSLKTLIMKKNIPAFYVHCFAHQLQLTFVTTAKNHDEMASISI
uniref:DUF4371 domain-containing protein n=1 Tax=Kalanchoe fedtschenkoi TaxID=63787 RepID=A0A7N0VCT0_KALFE